MIKTMRLCAVENCNLIHQAKGYCNKHYLRLFNFGSLELQKPIYDPFCYIENCSNKHKSKGLCNMHYQQINKRGLIYKSKKEMDPIERFLLKVDKVSKIPCWLWTGCRTPKGYGHFGIKKTIISAHRFSYLYFNGKIPQGISVLHKCDNPSCVNPEHLFLGNNNDNVKDKVAKGRAYRPIGEKNWNCKLNSTSVINIKIMLLEGKSVNEIKNKYNVSKDIIFNIKYERTWKHLTVGE